MVTPAQKDLLKYQILRARDILTLVKTQHSGTQFINDNIKTNKEACHEKNK